MAESGCLRDAHFQNLQVSGKPFFSRANDVTQLSSGASVTSNGASGTIVLADHAFDCKNDSGRDTSHAFRLVNNHINAESSVFLSLNMNNPTEERTTTGLPNMAFSIMTNGTRSLNCGVLINAEGNGMRHTSIGKLNYLVIN